ncbi:MAG: hypothetical protein LUQ69_03870 [Methanoregulaceae archaeon]|nr:hypothetical protein [Methanoregulaceae archaeon]
MKKGLLILSSLFVFLLLGPIIVIADIAPGDGVETQGIVSTTSISCVGTVTKDDVISWRASNEFLDANLDLYPNIPGEPYYDPNLPFLAENWIKSDEPPLKYPGEIQMVSAYTETTEAKNGYTEYSKTMNVDTAGKKIGLSNVQTHRNVQFTGIPESEGRITSSEEHVIDLVGLNVMKATNILCPFSEPFEIPTCIPPFCSIVRAGSDIDMTTVSFVTDASSRTVSEGDNFQNTPVPGIADVPVNLHYDISATGLSPGSYAEGRVLAYMDVHSQDGSSDCALPNVAAELVYNEQSVADGRVNAFNKIMDYTSGILRI